MRGRQTRPTADRVREALFNTLGTIPGHCSVVDLFAGTGALGLEALSRGAQRAVFIEHDPKALAVLQENIDHCGVQERSVVIRWNIVQNLNCLKPYPKSFGLIFMDPPYGQQLIRPTLNHLLTCGCLSPEAVIVIETAVRQTLADLPEVLICDDVRTYGGTKLWYLSLAAGCLSA